MQEKQTKTTENKYKNGKIYQITDKNFTECYIGSTIQSLAMRMGGHRAYYKQHLGGKGPNLASFQLFEKYGVDNCQILLLESFPCGSKEELCAREAQYIRKVKCVNKRIEGRTNKEWIDDNKEQRSTYLKQYRSSNRKHIQQFMKQYREVNKERIQNQRSVANACECGGNYRHRDKARHMRSKRHQTWLGTPVTPPAEMII